MFDSDQCFIRGEYRAGLLAIQHHLLGAGTQILHTQMQLVIPSTEDDFLAEQESLQAGEIPNWP